MRNAKERKVTWWSNDEDMMVRGNGAGGEGDGGGGGGGGGGSAPLPGELFRVESGRNMPRGMKIRFQLCAYQRKERPTASVSRSLTLLVLDLRIMAIIGHR